MTTTLGKTYITIDLHNSGQPPTHNHDDTYNPRTMERGLDCQQEEETERRVRRGTYGNRGDLPKIRNKSRKLPFGGGDTARTPHKLSFGIEVRRITRTGKTLLVPKDDRSRKLFPEVKDLNGKSAKNMANCI